MFWLTLLILSLVQFLLGHQQISSKSIGRYNSNLIELVEEMAGDLPLNSVIAQRKISLKIFFVHFGRSDVSYYYYSEDKEEVYQGLQQPGCVVLIWPKNDLGISDASLYEVGYAERYPFIDHTNHWRLLLKDCD